MVYSLPLMTVCAFPFHKSARVYDESKYKQLKMQTTLLKDGILVGAVGAYDWNGAVLKETHHGKVIPPKSSYMKEFPEELKNHAAYLGKKRFWLVPNEDPIL